MVSRSPDESTALDVRFLAGETPFTVLDLPLDAATAVVRRRLDELQLRARIEHPGDPEVAARYREAGNALQDPLRRLSAEFCSPWAGVATFDAVAPVHDAALTALRALLQARAQHSNGDGALVDAIRRWGALSADLAVQVAVNDRAAVLRARIGEGWLAGACGSALATLMQRGPVTAAAAAGTLVPLVAPAEALAAIGDAALLPAAQLLGAVREAITGPAAPPRERLTAAIAPAYAVAGALAEVVPADSAALRSTLARAVVDAARLAFTEGAYAVSELLLAALVAQDLDVADRVEAERELATLRAAMAAAAEDQAAARREAPGPAVRGVEAPPTSAARGPSPRRPMAGRSRTRSALLVGLALAIAATAAIAVLAPGARGAVGRIAGTGTAVPSTGDPDRDAIERARVALQRQLAEVSAMEDAVADLQRKVQTSKAAAGTSKAAATQYEQDLARYADLVARLKTAREAYQKAEDEFNRQVSAYNEKFRR